MFLKLYITLVVMLLAINPLNCQDNTGSYTEVKLIERDAFPFSEMLRESQLTIILGDNSCGKCDIILHSLVKAIKDVASGINIIRVQLVNRLSDSVAYKSDLDIQRTMYVDRASLENWDIRLFENKWIYCDSIGPDLVIGSLLIDVDLRHLNELIAINNSDRSLNMRVLSVFEEPNEPLIKPTFNQYISDSIMIVGSRHDTKFDVYNVCTGKRIKSVTLADTMFTAALKTGEWFYSNKMFNRPGFISAEMTESGAIILIAEVFCARQKDNGRIGIRPGHSIALVDLATTEIIWQMNANSISPDIERIAMHNASFQYPYLFTANCDWNLSDRDIYNSPCVRKVNIETAFSSSHSIVDSAYRILDIGNNYVTGYARMIGNDLYTAQPLSSRIYNETENTYIDIDDELYQGYYDYIQDEGARISGLTDERFDRTSNLKIKSIVRGIFGLEDQYLVIALMKKVAGTFVNYLSLYDINSGAKLDEKEIQPGWTIQRGNDEVLQVHIVKGRYQITSFRLD